MKLLLKGPYEQARLDFVAARLDAGWHIDVWTPEQGDEALAARLAEADALVAMSYPADAPPAPRLRLVQLPGTGLDRIAFAAVPDRCAVCNVFEHEIGIAEHLVLGMLEWEIRLCRQDRELRQGRWADGFIHNRPLHGELYGKTVGFIGYGHISRETARRLAPFGVQLIAATRSPDKGAEFLDQIAGMDGLDTLLGTSDYVVVACPLTDATRGLIGREQLAGMRAEAVIMNVGRGPIIDERALFEACRDATIGGAIIDTWYRYPASGDDPDTPVLPSEFPFHELDNVIMTPHSSGWSEGLLDRRWTVMCDNLNRLARGEPLRNLQRAPGGPPPA